jgi:dihydrofolate reductase
MATVYIEASVSLDGFISDPSNGGFEDLFAWCGNGDVPTTTANSTRVAYRTSPASAAHVRELRDMTGAAVVGRRLFDLTGGWGGTHPMGVPAFVVTHTPPSDWQAAGTPFTFVTDGLAAAVELARKEAGDKAVAVGPGSVAWQALDAGLVDQVRIDLVPILLGGGTRMFDRLSNVPVRLGDPRIIAGTAVTHLIYDVTDTGRP